MFVSALNLTGRIVGVTGRGISDIHSLESARVGLAMGRSGCSAAKDNSSLIVLDDNFKTIYNAIKWGSNIFENCRKFLQFQLTCNISCIMIVLIGCATVGASPFTVMQLLYINLGMDILGAIALATESPKSHTLHHREFRKDNLEITPSMRLQIYTQVIYQLIVMITLFFGGSGIFGIQYNLISDQKRYENGEPAYRMQHYTMMFHTFVLMNIVNMFNSRVLSHQEAKQFNIFN